MRFVGGMWTATVDGLLRSEIVDLGRDRRSRFVRLGRLDAVCVNKYFTRCAQIVLVEWAVPSHSVRKIPSAEQL